MVDGRKYCRVGFGLYGIVAISCFEALLQLLQLLLATPGLRNSLLVFVYACQRLPLPLPLILTFSLLVVTLVLY